MTLSSTRGLVRVAQNPDCEIQAAMAVEHQDERLFYRKVTGHDFEGEYGERESARRRGAKFESVLYENSGAELRRSMAARFGGDAERMYVRNLAEELPGRPRHELCAARLYRTRKLLQDVVSGRPAPDVIIQPQLSLPIGPGPMDFEYVSPDVLWVRDMIPGDAKSFRLDDEGVDPEDLALARLQIAAQVLALRHELGRLGRADLVGQRGLFIFATPYGLRPSPAKVESLTTAIREVERAISVSRTVRVMLGRLREADNAELHLLFDELRANFQDTCVSTCVLAGVCEERIRGQVRVLGDAAARALGPQRPVARIAELVRGSAPADPYEEALTQLLRPARLYRRAM